MGDSPYMITTGFSRTSDRQIWVWDSRKLSEPAKQENLDTMSGGLMPYYDNDNKMLWLAGKG
jgi:coronin-1B/1C/6